jgi:hypothetical protein
MEEPRNLAQKLLGAHQSGGDLAPGEEIDLVVDQVLIEDAHCRWSRNPKPGSATSTCKYSGVAV